MYENFFQLTKSPFSLVSDPGCIHVTPRFKEVMRTLVCGVLERRGCLTLTAEPGLGKTTVIRALCDYLVESNAQSCTISTPTITSSEFLELTLLNFGIEDIPLSKARRLKLLEHFLIRSNEAERVSVLIVDEAHNLTDEVLEEIRLLSNFEAGDRKLLQVVLAGQTQLNDRLNRPDLWQLKQRISTRLTLTRLDHDVVADYIRFRWSEASKSPCPFTDPALDTIAVWSRGIPRMVNIICHNALRVGCSEKSRILGPALVHKVCAELELRRPVPEYSKSTVHPVAHLLEEGTTTELAELSAVEPRVPIRDETRDWWLTLSRYGDSLSTQLGRTKTSLSSAVKYFTKK
jgi:general secretion pathway protein A